MTAPFTVAVTRTARRSEGGWFVQPEYCSSVIVNVREVLEVSMRTLMALSQATLNDPHSLRTRNYSHVDSAFVIVSWVVSVLSPLRKHGTTRMRGGCVPELVPAMVVSKREGSASRALSLCAHQVDGRYRQLTCEGCDQRRCTLVCIGRGSSLEAKGSGNVRGQRKASGYKGVVKRRVC
jgi:hypothetical protein